MKKPGLLLFMLIGLCPGFITGTASARNDSIPTFPDLVYEYRFAELDKSTPLGLEYNYLVRKYIEIYTIQRRDDVSRMLGLSKLYFPIFEHYLDKYDLPLELKYLSVVESGLNPLAKSSSGAMGLWQFLYNSAPMFDLEVSSYIDDRRDVYKSTEAACKYFKYLYQTFHDWHLALAAYNGGPGVVRNAIERSGGKTNLWELLPYLPEETQNYVPAFLAANYVMNFAREHRILATEPAYSFSGIDTVYLSNAVSFGQIAENIKISIDQLRFLNPRYKLDKIPEAASKQMLVLPQPLIAPFIEFESHILASNIKNDVSAKPRVRRFTYRVEKGDFLHKIAMKYDCSPADIRQWNRLPSDNIAPGQSLVIWIP
ncbi:MAG: transglycosylase SLT domain-containing protein [Bacteroidota bacterium]|nr:transglycosylase SLT domain-containing protein [Bacteroidota bacterium]